MPCFKPHEASNCPLTRQPLYTMQNCLPQCVLCIQPPPFFISSSLVLLSNTRSLPLVLHVGIALQSSVWPIVSVSSMALLGTVEAVQKCSSVCPRSRSRCNREDHGFLNSFSAVNFQVRLWRPAASRFWIESTGRGTQNMLGPPAELPEYYCGVGLVLLQCSKWTALANAVLGY